MIVRIKFKMEALQSIEGIMKAEQKRRQESTEAMTEYIEDYFK